MAIGLIWTFFQGPSGTLRFSFPTSVSFELHGQIFQITQVLQTIQQPPRWARPLFLAVELGLLGFLFLAYRRIKAFVNRLFFNPFDQANIRDLHLAVMVALGWQAVTLLGVLLTRAWVIASKTNAYETIVQALKGVPGIGINTSSTNLDLSSVSVLSVLGVNLTPLVVAAVLGILSAVLQQAAHVWHEERRLRQEQEFTI